MRRLVLIAAACSCALAAGARRELRPVLTPPPRPVQCSANPKRPRWQCLALVAHFGCANWLTWVGPACRVGAKKALVPDEGGCKWPGYCGFSCPALCATHAWCAWLNPVQSPTGMPGCFPKFSPAWTFVQAIEAKNDLVQQAMKLAVARWAGFIVGRVQYSITPPSLTVCGSYVLSGLVRIQDLHIHVDVRVMDGFGGAVAAGAACGSSSLRATGARAH